MQMRHDTEEIYTGKERLVLIVKQYYQLPNACPDQYLGKQSPPLPVAKLQISSTVSLEHFHCSQLLLALGKSPTVERAKCGDVSEGKTRQSPA